MDFLSSIPNGPEIALKSLLVDGALIRDGGNPSRFWRYEGGKRYGFPTWEVYLSWGYDGDDAALLPDAEINAIPEGSTFKFRDGTLIKGQGDTVYVVEHQRNEAFPLIKYSKSMDMRTKIFLLSPTYNSIWYPMVN